MKSGWEHFEHASDVGIRGIGPTRAKAFEQAALALSAVVSDLHLIEQRTHSSLLCRAPDPELLLVKWLNALICEMSIRGMLFCRYKVVMLKDGLRSEAWGEKIDPARHQPAVEVKAATHYGLEVRRRKSGIWIAQCVVDV